MPGYSLVLARWSAGACGPDNTHRDSRGQICLAFVWIRVKGRMFSSTDTLQLDIHVPITLIGELDIATDFLFLRFFLSLLSVITLIFARNQHPQ